MRASRIPEKKKMVLQICWACDIKSRNLFKVWFSASSDAVARMLYSII